MKCLNRNKTVFYFSTFEGMEQDFDDYGNPAGEPVSVFSNPVKAKGNISAATGQAETLQFGDGIHYDKVIVLDKNPGIDENSRLWIDTLPELKEDGTTETAFDYIVKKVAKSLNFVSIAVSRVDVDVS